MQFVWQTLFLLAATSSADHVLSGEYSGVFRLPDYLFDDEISPLHDYEEVRASVTVVDNKIDFDLDYLGAPVSCKGEEYVLEKDTIIFAGAGKGPESCMHLFSNIYTNMSYSVADKMQFTFPNLSPVNRNPTHFSMDLDHRPFDPSPNAPDSSADEVKMHGVEPHGMHGLYEGDISKHYEWRNDKWTTVEIKFRANIIDDSHMDFYMDLGRDRLRVPTPDGGWGRGAANCLNQEYVVEDMAWDENNPDDSETSVRIFFPHANDKGNCMMDFVQPDCLLKSKWVPDHCRARHMRLAYDPVKDRMHFHAIKWAVQPYHKALDVWGENVPSSL